MGMKKWFLASMSVSAIALLGCDEDSGPGETTGDTEELSQEEAEEILHEAIENSSEVESFVSTMEQSIQGQMDGEEADIQTNIEMEFAAMDNFRMFMDMNMDIGEMVDESMSVEMIFAEESLFFNLGDGAWQQDDMMMDLSELDELEEDMIGDHFEALLEYIEEVTVYEEEDTYVFQMNLDGAEAENFSTMIETQADIVGDEPTGDLAQMGINQMDYELVIDKDTLWQTAFTMDMVADGEQDGMDFQADILMTGTFSDYNEVDPIEAPQ